MADSDDAAFCRALPKLECHAHLNGSIPDATLDALISLKRKRCGDEVPARVLNFRPPDTLAAIEDFFPIFSDTIYRLTDTCESLALATRGVLDAFRDDGCVYLELRTTLRKDQRTGLTYRSYLSTVLDVLKEWEDGGVRRDAMMARLIVSVNWSHPRQEVGEIVDLAIENRRRDGQGFVVGVDICGDPSRSDAAPFRDALARAKRAGLGVTVHFAEIEAQVPLLETHFSLRPDRLGHATFLTEEMKCRVIEDRIPLELCITSNVACKTVASVRDHHFGWAIENDVPVLICSDDMLVFRNPPSVEYATALSLLPGDGPQRRRAMVELVQRGVDALFASDEDKVALRRRLRARLDS